MSGLPSLSTRIPFVMSTTNMFGRKISTLLLISAYSVFINLAAHTSSVVPARLSLKAADTTGICAGMVATNLVNYFSSYYIIFATYSTLQTVINRVPEW